MSNYTTLSNYNSYELYTDTQKTCPGNSIIGGNVQCPSSTDKCAPQGGCCGGFCYPEEWDNCGNTMHPFPYPESHKCYTDDDCGPGKCYGNMCLMTECQVSKCTCDPNRPNCCSSSSNPVTSPPQNCIKKGSECFNDGGDNQCCPGNKCYFMGPYSTPHFECDTDYGRP